MIHFSINFNELKNILSLAYPRRAGRQANRHTDMAKPINVSVKSLVAEKQICAVNGVIAVNPVGIPATNWFLELVIRGSILQISSVNFSMSLGSISIWK
jgi:hypothetical protein